jgi:transcription initiation factor TFIIF subunit beta
MADYLGIKPDPDAKGASPKFEEDVYEDAGDLEFNPDPAAQNMYMAKVPKYLWEQWATLDDDAEIRIGTIRQYNVPGPDGKSKVIELLYLVWQSC